MQAVRHQPPFTFAVAKTSSQKVRRSPSERRNFHATNFRAILKSLAKTPTCHLKLSGVE
jgi:hypothetical protein